MNNIQPFHLAIPVNDLQLCRKFYKEVLQCSEGRSSENWVDFNFFGHQLVLHQRPEKTEKQGPIVNPVDGQGVPVPHFGVVLAYAHWEKLADQLKSNKIDFVIDPYIRFRGEAGEQATMFFKDPEGNALEFKAFKNIDQLFAI